MPVPATPSLALRLREATRALHREVERAGVMRHLLRGQLSRAAYCHLLRNLHALYSSLETELQTAAQAHPVLRELVPQLMRRVPALEQDLLHLQGPGWRHDLPLTHAAQAYVQRLQALGQRQPLLLAAHAYVRYLGDLNGGQMLAGLVARQLQLPPGQGVAFYSFGPGALVDGLKQSFRDGLARVEAECAMVNTPETAHPAAADSATSNECCADDLVHEACSAFVRHRDLFEELDAPQNTPPEPAVASG